MNASSENPVRAAATALVAAAALAAFLAIFVVAGTYGSGARLFPRLIAVLGAVSAAIVLAQSCVRVRARRRSGGLPDASGIRWQDVVVSYVGPPVYAAMLYVLGFWIASAACLAGLLVLLGERRALLIVAITAGTLGAIWLMFEFSFGVHMPPGILFNA